eukprot:120524-Heterocapsa_arctica.AAC.2
MPDDLEGLRQGLFLLRRGRGPFRRKHRHHCAGGRARCSSVPDHRQGMSARLEEVQGRADLRAGHVRGGQPGHH